MNSLIRTGAIAPQHANARPVHTQDIGGDGGDNTLNGTPGDDDFDISAGGNDTVNGKGGADLIYAGGALTTDDHLNGGKGTDYIVLDGDYSAGLVLDGTVFKSIEGVALASGSAYTLTLTDSLTPDKSWFDVDGSSLLDALHVDGSQEVAASLQILASVGDDILKGGGGSDFIESGSGTDIVDGGGGFNSLMVIDFFLATKGLKLDLEKTGPQATGYGKITVSNIQGVYGTIYDDKIKGDDHANFFVSAGGNDTFIGRGGDDYVAFGGIDFSGILSTAAVMNGGKGSHDVLSFYELGTDGAITVDLTIKTLQDTGEGKVAITSFENVQGTFFNDTLTGNNHANALYGADGSDILSGGKGNDMLYGDKALVNIDKNGFDTLPFMVNVPTDTIGGDTLDGGTGDDTLYGGGGNDMLSGDDGRDTLVGGAGTDRLNGGKGSDVYLFNSAPESSGAAYDTVTGFNFNGVDTFDVKPHVKGIHQPITTGALSAGSFDTDLTAAIGTHLGKHQAVLFTASSGDLSGDTFLVVNSDGKVGYDAGHDLVVLLDHAVRLDKIDVTDFV